MKTFGITVTAKMRHAALWRAAKRLGSQSALARELGVNNSTVCAWCNLTRVPSKQTMENPEFQKKVLDVVGECVEDLFPSELRDATDFLNSTKVMESTQNFDVLSLAEMQAERMSLPAPSEAAEARERSKVIQSVLKTMTFREREAIKLRYGLNGSSEHTLEETARIFKVTRERVRQIEARAIRKMQQGPRRMILESV